MPANIPFIPDDILRFTDALADVRVGEAERQMIAATEALPGVMSPMPGAEHQPLSRMRVSSGLARFLTLQTEDLAQQRPDSPLKALDIGTFTGSSAAAMARGMCYGGTVISCDLPPADQEALAIAERYWAAAGLRKQIELRLAPATETLQLLLDTGQAGSFDIVFIDADKLNYATYYTLSLHLLRAGGRILLDNMLWSGRVANPVIDDETTLHLRELNWAIARDARVDSMLLTEDDGVLLVKKR